MDIKKLFIIGLLILIIVKVSAQSKEISYSVVESSTYNYYLQAKWDSLILQGKQAHKHQIDYYYLNYRMAVAYFYKNNFHMANHYFQTAVKQNNEALNDDFFRELYHLSLVYALRNDLAMDVALPSSSKIKDPMVQNQFSLFGGGGSMTNYDHKKSMKDPNPYYSEVIYQDAVNYWGLSYNRQFNSSFNLAFMYSNLHFLMKTRIEDGSIKLNEDYKISQYNIALIPEFSLGTIWQIRPVVGLASNKGYPFSIVDTINNQKVYDYWRYQEKNYMMGANIYANIRNIKFGLNFGFSNYSLRNQYQVGVNLTYYPFGNLNLYSFTEASLKSDRDQNDLILHQELGFKTFSFLWLELGGEFGEMKNYNDFSLGYGYNIADNMDMRLYTKFIFVISSQLNFSLSGLYVHKYTFQKSDYINKERVETRIDYDQWNIEGGLLWKF